MTDRLFLVKWPAEKAELHASSPEEAVKIALEYIKAKGLIEVQPHMPNVIEYRPESEEV